MGEIIRPWLSPEEQIVALTAEVEQLTAEVTKLREMVAIMECYVPCYNCDAIGWKCEECLVEDDLNKLREFGWMEVKNDE